MKLALLTGCYPPGACGVGDYVALLADALNNIGIDTHVVTSGDWRLLCAFTMHRKFSAEHFDIVQIHYPSLGFGTNLGPQGIALLRNCVVSLHEASQSHPLRKLALLPFGIRPEHVIVFSQFERAFVLKWAPWLAAVTSIIPPPSNIRKSPYRGPRNLEEIISFGLIRPGRGHDEILKLGSLIKAANLPLRIRVIGTPQSDKFVPYFDALRQQSASLPIIWDSGLSEHEVAGKLASSSIAYLPYPNGAAELRSTLKAALLNGLAIVTTRGAHTPRNLGGVVEFSATPEEALRAIRFLIDNPQRRAVMGARARRYVKDWTWKRTAERHAEIYEGIVLHHRSRAQLESSVPTVSNNGTRSGEPRNANS